jgi:hypothetical protein
MALRIPAGDQVVFFKGANTSFSQTVSNAAAGLYSLIYANCDRSTAASFRFPILLAIPHVCHPLLPHPHTSGAVSVRISTCQ